MLEGGIAASSVLFEKYRVTDIVYESDTVTVYSAEHMFMSAKRIIKKILKRSICRDNFYSEVNILKSIRHPSIPIVYDVEEDAFAYYIIEEHMEGITLDTFVRENGILAEKEAIDIGIKLCDIVSFLHCRKPVPILFLDVHPKNILINVETNQVFLVDFGSSYYSDETEKRKLLMGTVGYAAPEQYEHVMLDERTDIYGIGAVLYFLVTGKNFVHENILSDNFHKNISEQFMMIISRCLAADRNDRFRSVDILEKNLSKKISNSNICIVAGKPHIISFVGTDRRVGVTHISLAFAKYLSKQGYSVLYEESNSSNHARQIAAHYKMKYYNGIFYHEELMLKPLYGTQINLEMDCDIIVRDCGAFSDNEEYIESICADNSVVVMVAGTKPWELEASTKVCRDATDRIRRMRGMEAEEGQNSMHILCNGNGGHESLILWKRAGCMVKRVPTLDDIFTCNEVESRFFSELADVIKIDIEGGKVYKKTNRLFRKFAKKAADNHRRHIGRT